MNSQWIRGNKPRIRISFYDRATKAFIDPTSLLFKWRDLEGNENIYIYGSGSEITRDELGKFHVDVPIDTSETKGKIYCRWEARDASDVVLAAAETILEVKSDYVEVGQ
jgi:hypothetical protein